MSDEVTPIVTNWKITDLVGKVLRIDLTTRKVSYLAVGEKIYRRFLGGRGLNQYLLFENLDRGTTSFDPENLIVFGTGLLVGTSAPGAVRLSIDTKNAFSGGVGSANAGGDFGRALKSTGVGTLIVTGRSENPVYIAILNEHVTIKDASPLWGKTVSQTVAAIRSESGETTKVLCIGPAGENLVRGANVMVDGSRAAAKCGVGAVMGSKNLKAVAVTGDQPIKVASPDHFRDSSDRLWEKVSESEVAETLNTHGTLASINAKNPLGAAPYRHYQDGYIDQRKIEAMNEEAFKRLERRRFGPIGCPLKCRARYGVEVGPYAGTEGEAMQCNSIQDFGIKLDITDPAVILKANLLSNEYGMDMDTVAESVAWAFECFQEGILDSEDTEGLTLNWGNAKALLTLIERIAYRKGFGDTLAEGTKRAAKIVGKGSEEFAVTMKGQDLYEAVQMPKGYGLGAALATRGGGHCSGSPLCEFFHNKITPEVAQSVYGVPTASDPAVYEGKGKLVADHERLHAVLNSLGMCFFVSIWESPDMLGWDDLTQLINQSTGWAIGVEDVKEIGERVHTLERMFNHVHAGLDRKDDYLPARFFDHPIQSGAYKGELLEREKYDAMLNENYGIHGWDVNGIPQTKTLKRLGLSSCGHNCLKEKRGDYG